MSGAYVPPFLRKKLEEEAAAKELQQDVAASSSSAAGESALQTHEDRAMQSEYWEALKRTLMGIVNRTTISTVAFTSKECLRENVLYGRGLLCRALLRAQFHSPELTPVLASLAAAVNAKVPAVGRLLIERLIFQFKRCYKRRDIDAMSTSAQFIAHLAAQRVVSEIAVLKLLATLLCGESPSADDIRVACDVFRASFAFLQERLPTAFTLVLDPIRELIGSGKLDLRSSTLLEGLLRQVSAWQEKKDKIPVIPPELDLVPVEEAVTHQLDMDDPVNPQNDLDIFKFDPDFIAKQEEYEEFKNSIPGLDDEDVFEMPEPPAQTEGDEQQAAAHAVSAVDDLTTEQIDALRRAVFLILQSSIRAEEVVHKFLGQIPQGREEIAANMIAEAMTREKTYKPLLGSVAELLCRANGRYQAVYEKLFAAVYTNIDDFDTRRVDIYARFFAQLLQKSALNWRVLDVIKLTMMDTTVFSRRFIRVMLQDLGEQMTVKVLKETLNNVELRPYVAGLFAKDGSIENGQFVVDYFESISAEKTTVDLRPLVSELRSRVEAQLASQAKRPRD